MANRWETMETVTDFVFLGSKITVNGHCSHETKRHLLLGREAMTNLDSIYLLATFCTLGTLLGAGYIKVHLILAKRPRSNGNNKVNR